MGPLTGLYSNRTGILRKGEIGRHIHRDHHVTFNMATVSQEGRPGPDLSSRLSKRAALPVLITHQQPPERRRHSLGLGHPVTQCITLSSHWLGRQIGPSCSDSSASPEHMPSPGLSSGGPSSTVPAFYKSLLL
jgi:hypothetical protein